MRLASTVVLLLVATTVAAETRVVQVSNYGQDSPGCGSFPLPCRSITQAIANANEGDTVIVGPGLYGDLNRNGVFGELGEERTRTTIPGCVICIPTRITVLSQRGAAHTTIDLRGVALAAVLLNADGAAFGYAEQGFTVLGSHVSALSGTVWGNRIVGAGLNGGPGAAFYDNEVTDSPGTGIVLFGGRASGNVIARNASGIRALGNVMIDGNTIVDNRGPGARLEGVRSGTIVRNVFIRNAGPGVQLVGDFPAAENRIGIFSNDFIGNDPQGFCGIDNQVAGEVWATNNFWAGAADVDVFNQFACNGPASTTHIDPRKLSPHY